jgi:hypothetical protein
MRTKGATAKPIDGLQKLVVLVTPEVASLLRNEAIRRNREAGTYWPLGAIIDELVRREFSEPVNGPSS